MRARTATGGAAAIVLLLGAGCSGGHKAAPVAPTAVVEASTTTTARRSTSTTTRRSTTTLRAVTRATAPPPGPCCSPTPHGPITVSFTGLSSGQKVPNNGQVVPFTVTFTNNTTTNYQSVAPVAAAEHYEGGTKPNGDTHGSLQRYNASTGTWQEVGLGQGEGMDFIYSGDSAAFALPAGQSVSVRYRMSLTKDDGPGTLGIDGLAVRPSDHQSIGNVGVPITVVSG